MLLAFIQKVFEVLNALRVPNILGSVDCLLQQGIKFKIHLPLFVQPRLLVFYYHLLPSAFKNLGQETNVQHMQNKILLFPIKLF